MRNAILLPAAVLLVMVFAFSSSAAAESIVPPGNSAASQYTEAFPTPQGEQDSEGRQKTATPAKVLGSKKAHRLEQQGPAGQAVANFAAETSPAAVDVSGEGEASNSGGGKRRTRKPGDGGASEVGGEEKSEASVPPGAPSSGGSGGGAEPSGSSGTGEVVGQATGLSSGTLGLLLPLILAGVVIWSGFYVWRSRQRVV
jgi:hypothetical protein